MEKQAKIPLPKRPLTREEVAALIGKSEKYVYNLERRALLKMREQLRRIA